MANEEPGLLSVSAATNSLNLVLYGKNLMHFVKYVSAAAPGSRWDVACEFTIDESLEADDEDDDQVEEGDNDDDDADEEDDEDDAAAQLNDQPDTKRLKTRD